MKGNNVKSLIFVKIATVILLACTNQTFNDSDKLGTSLVKNVTANGESDLRIQRLLGEGRSIRDSLLLDSFYDDDDEEEEENELFDYNSDRKSRRDVKSKHHSHRHSHRHKHRDSHRHRTSRSKREEKNSDADEVLSLSRFVMDDDDDDDEKDDEIVGKTSSSQRKSNDYDDIINLTNSRSSNPRPRVSSRDVESYLGREDDYTSKRRSGSRGTVKKTSSYSDNKNYDTMSSLDKYNGYYGEGRRYRKKGSGKVAKVFGLLGAFAVSHKLIAMFLTTSNVVALPLAASACILGGILLKNKSKKKYGGPPVRSITY